VAILSRVRIRSDEEIAQLEAEERRRLEAQTRKMNFEHADTGGFGSDEEAAQAQALASLGEGVLAATPATGGKIGRNEPCPCGSGKKYKQCHGQLA